MSGGRGHSGQGLPESPFWILRHHAPNSIHQLRLIKPQNASLGLLLAAGDSQGRISLTSLRDYRPRYFWNAHKESILGVDLVRAKKGNILMSSGRDNLLHVHSIPDFRSLTSQVLPSRIQADLPVPGLIDSLDINSLNYCPFSVLANSNTGEVLIALPHTVDSGYIDVYDLPTKRRVATAIGKGDLQTKGVQASRAAIVMSMHMFKVDEEGVFCIIAGYEDGYVKRWKVHNGISSLEWSQREHSESVMAMAVSSDQSFCFSVAADFQVVRYDMKTGTGIKSIRSNSAGHACVAIREDGHVIAVGGWDGCIRLYDSDLTQLGSLRYHKDTVQALSFVQTRSLSDVKREDQKYDSSDDDSESDESRNDQEEEANQHLLVSGGKEGRICLWKTWMSGSTKCER